MAIYLDVCNFKRTFKQYRRIIRGLFVKYNNYTDLGIVSAKKPQNTHLWWELTSGVLYLVDSADNTKMYYSVDKGDNWVQLDIDPSDSSVDNKSRDHKIRAGFHDRGNSIIWFVDCDNDGTADNFDVWKLDYSGSEIAPTATEIGTSAGADVNTVYAGDIFVVGGNTYVINMEDRAATLTTVSWDVDTAPFVEQANFVPADADSAILGYGVIAPANNDFYLTVEFLSGANYTIGLVIYDYVTDDFSETSLVANYRFTANDNQLSASFDNSNIIQFVGRKIADGLSYLISHNISGASEAVGGQYNVALMLDRNTLSSSVLEKAFHLTEYKVYQIQVNAQQLNLIAVPDTGEVIIGITDNFLITTTGKMFEYEDQITLISSAILDHEVQEASQGIVTLIKGSIPIVKNMLLQFFHNYTTATATSEEIIFEGIVTNFTEDQMQTVTLVNPAKKEVKTILPSRDYTKDSDGLISQLIIDFNKYATEGTLSDGGDLGTISLGGVLSEETIFDGCAKFDGFEWYFNPVGALFYNNGTVDSGVNYTQASVLSGVNISHVHEEYNRIKVRGAYVDGVQVESDWQEDLDSQQRIGINERIFLISFLNTIALCNTAASNILIILAKDPLRVKFTIKDTTKGYIQVGETITFEYAASGKTVASDQFIITSATINKYGDVRYTIVSELS